MERKGLKTAIKKSPIVFYSLNLFHKGIKIDLGMKIVFHIICDTRLLLDIMNDVPHRYTTRMYVEVA